MAPCASKTSANRSYSDTNRRLICRGKTPSPVLDRKPRRRFHGIAPDYPGFGNSDTPDPATFSYTFDRLAEVVEHFLAMKGFHRFGLYVQDYGGPVGFRIVTKKPEVLEWLIIQNTKARVKKMSSCPQKMIVLG